MSNSVKVLIVGLGNVGMLYDYNSLKNTILSHSRAFFSNDFFELIGGIDLNEKNRNIFENLYKVKAYEKIEDFQFDMSPDLVVISTPTNNHFESIKNLLKLYSPR